LYLPVILDPEYHYEKVNVEMQERNTSSLLWWTKRLINTRKKYKAFSRGDTKFINSENPKILAFTRTYEDETMLVVVNLSQHIQPVELDLNEFAGYQPVEVFSKNKFPSIKTDTPYFFTLGPHDCQWFQLQKINATSTEKKPLPELELKKWDDLLYSPALEQLKDLILPEYLMQMRWFGGKARNMQTVRVINEAFMPLEKESAAWLLVEVVYESGLPEYYQLCVAFAREEAANKLKETCPKAPIAKLRVGKEHGMLYDAFFSFEVQGEILRRLANNHDITLKNSEVQFTGSRALKKYVKENGKVKSRVLSAEQSNTSIAYDSAFFLKFYRKVDRAVNPDLEVTKFLTEKAKFKQIPAYSGSIEWVHNNGTMVLGMVQQWVESSGDAWTYMLDKLIGYNERILSKESKLPPIELLGDHTNPLSFELLPEALKELLDASVAERARLLGVRTGEMHLALASDKESPDFKPEEFSLHYQRSLFSSFQTLVRSTFQSQQRNLKRIPEHVRADAEDVLHMKDDILQALKRIYRKKFDALKIRIHGDYHLGQVLFTGKDFVILDFEGEPARSYSERRLKRSPLRDVAGMVRSFHYAAYGALFLNDHVRKEDIPQLLPYAEQWYHYMSSFFMQAYLETVDGNAIVPNNKEDLDVMLQTYILEKAIYELNYELNNRPDWVLIPIRGIKAIMEKAKIEKPTVANTK
jgi:maltose alpha-D-glucosyltransferase / alpha-amylase